MTPYLPKYATIEQACDWLEHETGESWILARLLECHLKPWIWIDYKPGWPDIFGSRLEGYLAPMVFAGDTQRMEADGTDALVTMTRTHDGKLLKIEPGWRVPLAEIRFKRENIQRVLEIVSASSVRHVNAPAAREEAAPAPPVPAPDGPPQKHSDQPDYDAELAALFDAVTAQALETMFPDGRGWESHAERAARNGLRIPTNVTACTDERDRGVCARSVVFRF
ncbi:hypothetical protein [Aromatoleum aromaticum]|uniref:hypothetical protein n=1 Tax=Aromatoleum aromaticum TaxID=551760 RepID=UPI0014597B09|nr:hypothetical protein [Aromatoleum aromaticum]NMG56858.1 hypothetical protein [Aromatoleum aromaticum]